MRVVGIRYREYHTLDQVTIAVRPAMTSLCVYYLQKEEEKSCRRKFVITRYSGYAGANDTNWRESFDYKAVAPVLSND